MTPSILMLNLSLGFAALSALCLSLNRHHGEIVRANPSRRRVLLLRAVGWAGIGLSLLVAGRRRDGASGPSNGSAP